MKSFSVLVSLWAWSWIVAAANSARILGIFPMPFKSRFTYNEAIMRSLFDAGHEITVITPFPSEERLKNYTIIDSSPNTVFYVGQTSLNQFKKMDLLSTMRRMGELDEKNCENVLKLTEMQNVLSSKDKPFDVMFVDVVYMYECYLPIAEKLSIPVIGTVSFRSWKSVDPAFTGTVYSGPGDPYNPAVVPFEIVALSKSMTFFQRLQNTWYHVLTDFIRYLVVSPKIRKIYERHYPANLCYKKRLSLMFYNNHPALLSRPLAPNSIEIGGVHIGAAKPLPQNIQKFIDESEHGVILFSLGSVLKSSSMDLKLVHAFRDAFAAIPQRVIWKFEDKIDDLPDNVLTMGWLPQRDILAHKNVKAFITHCGMSGMYEAIYEGKPLVVAPLFWDQLTSGAILEELGVGLKLDIRDYSVTNETILNALNAVIKDRRYRERMEDLSRQFKDRPLSPQQMVVYWTEYVIRHQGAPHLRTVAADMPLYRYLLLDVIISLMIVSIIILCALHCVLKISYRYVCRNGGDQVKLKKKNN